MKNKKIILAIIIILIAVAGAVHTTISYISILNDKYTSLPATTALLLLVPYSVAIAVCLIVGCLIIRRTEKK